MFATGGCLGAAPLHLCEGRQPPVECIRCVAVGRRWIQVIRCNLDAALRQVACPVAGAGPNLYQGRAGRQQRKGLLIGGCRTIARNGLKDRSINARSLQGKESMYQPCSHIT